MPDAHLHAGVLWRGRCKMRGHRTLMPALRDLTSPSRPNKTCDGTVGPRPCSRGTGMCGEATDPSFLSSCCSHVSSRVVGKYLP